MNDRSQAETGEWYDASLAALRTDARMAALIERYGPPDLSRYHGRIGIFAALLRSIIYQQVSGHAARAIHARVLALFPGRRPTPALLRRMHARRLRGAGLSVQKITYVKDLARRFDDGEIDVRRMRRMTSDEVVAHLVRIKGVGRWTAHMLLIFTMHRLDILPTGDLAIQKGFKTVYGLRSMPDHDRMERIARPWRAHASVASWYLWRVADDAKG